MLKRITLLAIAALCCSTAAFAQQLSKTPTHQNDYSVAHESTLKGTVVKYTATSTTAPVGARVELQTSSGIVDVHLGNARLLTANHLSLEAGDSVSIVGEYLPFGGGSFYAARVIAKGLISVTLRSKNGIPLLVSPRTTGGQQPAAGAR
jgi:hypothetical protein